MPALLLDSCGSRSHKYPVAMLTWICADVSSVTLKHTTYCAFTMKCSSAMSIVFTWVWTRKMTATHICWQVYILMHHNPCIGVIWLPEYHYNKCVPSIRVWAHDWRHKAVIMVSVPEDRTACRAVADTAGTRQVTLTKSALHSGRSMLLTFTATLMVQF